MWCISDPSDSMDNFNRFGQCQKFKLDIKSSEFIESKASKSVDVFNGCDFKKIVLIMMWWSFTPKERRLYWHSSAYEMLASLQISCAW